MDWTALMLAGALIAGPPQELDSVEDPVLRVGEVVTDELSAEQPAWNLDAFGTRAVGRRYRVELDGPGPYRIELRSLDFDSYLVLESHAGVVVAQDDDGLVELNAVIEFEAHGGEELEVVACALHGFGGEFELRLLPGHAPALDPGRRAQLDLEMSRRRTENAEARYGPDDPATAVYVRIQANICSQHGRYEEARELYERALAIRELSFGPDHLRTAESLHDLGMLLTPTLGRPAEAGELFERALEIFEAVRGPEDAWTAMCEDNLGMCLYDLGRPGEALPLIEHSLATREKVFGPLSAPVAWSLNNLAMVKTELGRADEARALHERALRVAEATRGDDDPDVATLLDNLGHLDTAGGRLADARAYFERALAILEATLGPGNPRTSKTRGNLAVVLVDLGLYEEARELHERSLEVSEQVYGPDHPRTARDLSNLALALDGLGFYEEARGLLERALEIREGSLGPEDPETALSLGNLGTLLCAMGAYEEARPLLERSLAIREKALGPFHPDVALLLANLGAMYFEQGLHEDAGRATERSLSIYAEVGGQPRILVGGLVLGARLHGSEGRHDEAVPLLVRALETAEARLGPEHPHTAAVLTNLGTELVRLGRGEEAVPHCERALAVYETSVGTGHPWTAAALAKEAAALVSLRRHAEARPLYERALSIRTDVLGSEHPYTLESLNELSSVLFDLGERERAWELAIRSARGRGQHLSRVLASSREQESYAYLARSLWQLELLQSLGTLEGMQGHAVEAYEAQLEWKGQVLRLLRSSRAPVFRALGPEQRRIVTELRHAQAELSRLAFAPFLDDRPIPPERLVALKDQRNALELEWARSLGPGKDRQASFDELRSALPAESVLVDFFVRRSYSPALREGTELIAAGSWSGPRLTAWITRRDAQLPTHLDLGPVEEVEAAVRGYLESRVSGELSGDAARRGIGTEEGTTPTLASELRRLLWKPLVPYLDGARLVIVSPDGFLGTFPFEVLEDESGAFLIEEYSFVYLEDAASLAQGRALHTPSYDSVLVVGGVDFDQRDTPADDAEPRPGIAAEASALRGGFSDWAPLSGTLEESRDVIDLHAARYVQGGTRLHLTGGECTEDRLKLELSRHAVAHLATHGFFQPEGMANIWQRARGDRAREAFESLVGHAPGLLSGLVCAGVNAPATNEGDDGYLTAEEVAWLDLSRVELVVLSACETGLGRAQSGEGLIGLRRAFHTAGARTVVSSLWSVPDDSTAELMRSFYENLWVEGLGKLESLRSAQLALLAENRREHGSALPSTWGGFVLGGEWH